jgi:O-antigen ligase
VNIIRYTLDAYEKFQTENTFVKVFKIILFIWIFFIPLKNSIYQISTFLLITLFAIHYFSYKQKAFLWNILTTYQKLITLFLLFIASMTLSSLMGVSTDEDLALIAKYFFRYILILTILFYFYKQSFFSKRWLLVVVFTALLIHSLNGIYQYITGVDFILNKLTSQDSYKLTGAVYHHNPFGLLMAIGSAMSLVLFFDKHNYTIFKHDKIIYLLSLFIFLFTLFNSQSRSAWVMFGVFSLGYMFIYLKKNGLDKKLVYTISSLLIGSTVLFLMDDHLLHRFMQLLQGNSSGRTTVIWPFTIEKIMDSPILGYGINTFKMLAVGTPAVRQAGLGVHNLTLEIILYTGIVGFIIFSYIIWLTLKESFTKDKIFYFILFLSFIILMQFDGSLITSKVHLNIFILMLFFIYSFRLDKNTSS